jgi:hypothetical protein
VAIDVEAVVLDYGRRGSGGAIGVRVVLSELAHHLGGDSRHGFAGALCAALQLCHCCIGKRDLQPLGHWSSPS